jgi:hypothetical protein
LEFRGVPTRLTATVQSSEELLAEKTGCVVLPDTVPLPLTIRPVRSTTPTLSTLSFRLPKSTPPGSYKGNAELAGTQIPIVVNVEARPRLRFIPAKVSLHGRPGASIKVDVVVLNLGNVSIRIEPRYSFCMFDGRGIDQAFFQALTSDEPRGKRRIDHLMDELAESHGGLARAIIQEGQGVLAPEESRELIAQFQFSRRMRPGRTYRGAWFISEASLEVEIETSNETNKRGR